MAFAYEVTGYMEYSPFREAILKKTLISKLITTAIVSLATTSAYAQNNSTDSAENNENDNVIIVTAQKRDQALNDVPLAISAVGGETLEAAEISSVTALIPYVPGLTGSATGIATNVWNIRGIGTNDFTVGSEPAVAVFLDDAYIGRNVNATTAFYDVERIEVVKGPQGTLFGRNASAGAINVITRKPENRTYAKLGFGYGNDSQTDINFVGNVAVSDAFQLRLAYNHEDFRGVQFAEGPNGNYFADSDAARLTAKIEPSPFTTILLSGHFSDAQSNRTGLHNAGLAAVAGLPGAGDPFADRISLDSLSFEDARVRGANLRITQELTDDISLTSISDWRSWDYSFSQDLDGIGVALPVDLGDIFFGAPGTIVTFGPPRFFQPNVSAETISQELRLNGTSDQLDWFIGGSYFKEDVSETAFAAWPMNFDADALLGGGGVVPVLTETNPASYQTSGDYESFALYADATFHVSDAFSLTGGIRWTRDNKDFCSLNIDPTFGFLQFLGPDSLGMTICGSNNTSKVTYRGVADFKVTEDVLLYASYATGYKGGGFNSSLVGSGPFGIDAPFALVPFRPETSKSIELGAKATLGDLQANLAVYFTDYDDLQLLDNTISLRISNLAGVKSDGAELELIWNPISIDGLTVSANYAYNNNRISAPGQALDGSVLSIAPKNTFATVVQYEHELGDLGRLAWFAGYTWQDDILFDINGARIPQNSYGVADASLKFTHKSERFDLTFSANNVFDKNYLVSAADPLGLGSPLTLRGNPFQFKFSLNVYFGEQ